LAGIWGADDDEHRVHLLKCSALGRGIGRAISMAVLLCTGALAQHADISTASEDSASYREIVLAEPQLPNRPARRENISDEEVREIQRVALEVYPDFIVVISSVTDGCACEEGAHCSAQVALALNRNNVTRSLLLSKVDEHWKIGAVQSWWLRYRKEHTDMPASGNLEAYRTWQEKERSLLRSFPACPVPAGNWILLRNASYGSTYVDRSSLKVSGFIRRVNFRNVYPVRPIPYFPLTRFSIASQAFDCRDHRTRTDSQTSYWTDGTAHQESMKDPVLWEPVRPDTIPAKDLDLVCGWNIKE
jgi:hypothetical protein